MTRIHHQAVYGLHYRQLHYDWIFFKTKNNLINNILTWPATRYFFRYLTGLSFGNHRVAGNPKHRVLPYISGKPKFRVLPDISGITCTRKQYHHQVLFIWTLKKDPRVQKKCKIYHLPSSMTVELLLVGQSLFNQPSTLISTKGALRRCLTYDNHPIPSIHSIRHITLNELDRLIWVDPQWPKMN